MRGAGDRCGPRSRDELFDLVCEAAATAAGSPRPPSRWRARQRLLESWPPPARRPSDAARQVVGGRSRPEGRGLSGTAFRTRRPCITNDYRDRPARRGFPGRSSAPTARSQAPPFRCWFAASRRRHDLHVAGQGHVHARILRTAAAIGRQRVVRAGEFRPRRRQGADRGPEGAPDAHAGGAERDQRGDHPRDVPGGTVRTGVRGRGATAASSPRPRSR